jgi:hypothetical protein
MTSFISPSLAFLTHKSALPPNVRFEPVDPEKELMNLEPKAFEMAWCTRAKFWFTLVLFMSVQCLHC